MDTKRNNDRVPGPGDGRSPFLERIRGILKNTEPVEEDYDFAKIERSVLDRFAAHGTKHGGKRFGFLSKPAFAGLLLGFAAFAGVVGLVATGTSLLPYITGQPPAPPAPDPHTAPPTVPRALPPDSALLKAPDTPDSIPFGAPLVEERIPVNLPAPVDTVEADTASARAADSSAPPAAAPAPMPIVARDLLGQAPADVRRTRTGAQRTSSVSLLRLPVLSDTMSVLEQELERVAQFAAASTGIPLDYHRPIIAMDGFFRSFDHWLRHSKRNLRTARQMVSRTDPEQSGFDMLGSVAASLVERDIGRFRENLRNLLTDYLRTRYAVKPAIDASGWAAAIGREVLLPEWERGYLDRAEESYRNAVKAKKPSGKELFGVYQMLRVFQILDRPILLCEPAGVPASLSEENLEMLREYIARGGFLYVCNISGMERCQGIRDLFRLVLDEKVADSVGERTFARLQRGDRMVTGFSFEAPRPRIFHPSTLFPMIIPYTCDVEITVLNRTGTAVFGDTLRKVPQGQYLHRFKDYRWSAVDRTEAELPSGYYIYQVEAGLYRTTHSFLVSRVRRLRNGRHPVFTSHFTIRDVPTARRIEAEDLPYGESGVFGAEVNGGIALLYTEGYGEMDLLIPSGKKDEHRQAVLRWMTNVIAYALAGKGLR